MSFLLPLDEEILQIYANSDTIEMLREDVKRMAKEIASLRSIYRNVRYYELGGKGFYPIEGPGYDPVKSWKAVKMALTRHDNLIGRHDD